MTTNRDDPGRSGDLLARLGRLHPTAVVLTTVAVFVAVLLLPDPVGGVLVLLLAGLLGWLLSRTWPVLSSPARAMRVVVIALLLAIAALKFFS